LTARLSAANRLGRQVPSVAGPDLFLYSGAVAAGSGLNDRTSYVVRYLDTLPAKGYLYRFANLI